LASEALSFSNQHSAPKPRIFTAKDAEVAKGHLALGWMQLNKDEAGLEPPSANTFLFSVASSAPFAVKLFFELSADD
jgi:hypothetical protein